MTEDVDGGESQEPILTIVPRELVELGETDEVLMGLTVFVRSRTLAPQARGRLRLHFAGYDFDARELWEIPEVRRYVARLDAVFPYWFFLADLESETLHLIASCLCRVTEVAPGQTAFNREDLDSFFERQFGGMNQLWEMHRLPDAENVDATERIVAYFGARQILN